jgi:Holliday junction resolvase
MRAKRTDQNQKEIVKILRDLGCSIFDTSSIGKGYPDINVGYKGQTYLVEIKSSKKATFTEQQLEFQKNWLGSRIIRINSVEEAIAFVKNMV